MSRSRYFTLFLMLVGMIIGLLLSMESGAAHAAPIPNEGTFQLTGHFGGMFTKMHVVNDSIVLAEGATRVVIYSADGYGVNDGRWRAKSPHLGKINDLTAVPDGATVKIYTISTTAEGSTLSAWTYADKALQLDRATIANGLISLQATDEQLYGLTTKALIKLTPELEEVSRLDISMINVYWGDKPAINGNRAYVPTDRGIAIVNTDLMELIELWKIGGVSQVAVDAEGTYLVARVMSESFALYDDDYIVYELQTRIRKFKVWDGERISFMRLPRTRASLHDGRLLIASGYERLRIWDIETGTQLNGLPQVVTSMSYPSEAVQVENRVYIIDAFQGVFIKEYLSDRVSQEGGSLDESFLFPSMSDVAQVRQAGRYLVTVGKGGVLVYDPITDRITGNKYWVGWHEIDMKDASVHVTRPSPDYYQVVIGESSLVTYRIHDDGKLRYVSGHAWLGDTFVPTSNPELVATITTDDQPAIITLTNPSTGKVEDVIVSGDGGRGIDITSDGKWVYTLTKSSAGQYVYDLSAYEITFDHFLTFRWKWSGNANGIFAHQGTIWYTDGSIGRLNNEGEMWGRQISLPAEMDSYMSSVLPMNPMQAIVGERVQQKIRMVTRGTDNSLTLGKRFTVPGYVESMALGNNGILVAMGLSGISTISTIKHPGSTVYLPLVAR